jgi:tetratricopeptide (TPR) repeat protein
MKTTLIVTQSWRSASLSEGLNMPNSNLQTLLEEAYSALDRGDLVLAKELLDQSRQADPEHRDTALLEIDILEADQGGEEAMVACEELSDRFPDDLLVQYRLATLFLDIYSEIHEARPLLEHILEKVDAGESVTLAGESLNNTDEQKSFRLDLLLTISDCRLASGDPFGALEASEAAVEIHPEDPMAQMSLATAYFELGRLDESDQCVAGVLQHDPGFADGFWLQGRILTFRGDSEKAETLFVKATTLAPDRFSMPYRVHDADTFQALVHEGLETLPDSLRKYFKAADIRLERLPTLKISSVAEPHHPPTVLALCGGQPALAPSGAKPLSVWPEYLSLFQENLEIASESKQEFCELLIDALVHETAQFFQVSDEEFIENIP